jgi:L-iditol 2-dehydrogenase
MKAAKLFGPKDTRVVEVERPTPGPGEILVAVKAVSICPSDLRLWEDGHAGGTWPDHPFTQGHEFSGAVAELGPGVEGPPPATPVAVTPLWACGKCDMCLEGLSNICRKMVFPSFPQADGSMCEYMAVPAWSVEPLPPGISFSEAALMEPLQAAVHGVELGRLAEGTNVAVIGAGIIGLFVLQAARASGANNLYAADPIPENRELAEKYGAAAVAPFAADLLELLPDSSRQPRVVFECSGHPVALHQSMDLCRPAGLVVIIGVPHPDVVNFDTRAPRRKELNFVFSRRYRKEDLKSAVALVAEGKIDLGGIPVETFSLDEAPEAMRRANERTPGVLRTILAIG